MRLAERKQVATVEDLDDELMGIVGDAEPLLNCGECTAICRQITKVYFAAYQRQKWVFRMDVVTPLEHASQRLQMFVRIDPKWKKGTPIPRSSKLYACASIALGRRLLGRDRITKSMFVGKLYRCRLRQVGTAPATYSIVDMILEKVVG